MWMSCWCLSHIKFDIIPFTIFLRVILILCYAGSNVKLASVPCIYMQTAPLQAGISTCRCLFMSVVCAAVEVYTVSRSQLKSKHL